MHVGLIENVKWYWFSIHTQHRLNSEIPYPHDVFFLMLYGACIFHISVGHYANLIVIANVMFDLENLLCSLISLKNLILLASLISEMVLCSF